MESVEIEKLFKGIYKGKKVLVTGHTGFKGTWLTYWLIQLGAKVIGYSIDIPTDPSHFKLLELDKRITHLLGDIRNQKSLINVFDTYEPDVVFHLAAQSLVRPSYQSPIDTFNTNVMGTAHLLECCRRKDCVSGIVNVTSDKCYENFEDDRPYKEEDRMGGYDPYSASKGAAELITNSYRSSFFNLSEYGVSHNSLLASARAGNVIGGGDWSKNRLIPDIVKSVYNDEKTSIRSPYATRPWQHVLEPLSGYLLIGQYILEGKKKASEGWNFGPINNETMTVQDVITIASEEWGKIKFSIDIPKDAPHEAKLLRLDCSKAIEQLTWKPVWSARQSILKTVQWYKTYYNNNLVTTQSQFQEYVQLAVDRKYIWTL